MQNNGNIGIGTKSPAYKLDVIGTIFAREILVDLNGVGGADFVFDTNYRLRPLSEVQSFITENALSEHWNEEGQYAYLTDSIGNVVYSFDNARSLAEKCRFANQKQLRGAM